MTSSATPFRHSLSVRLSLVVAAAIFAAVMCAAVAVTLRELRRAADARADMIEAAASAYAGALAGPLADKDRRAALDYMRGLQDLNAVISMTLKDKDGGVLARMGAGGPSPGKPADLRTREALDLLSADRGAVSMPVVRSGTELGSIYILVDITDLRADLLATLGWASLVGLVAIGGGVAAAQLAISRMTRPLRQLAGVMTELGDHLDFTQRADPLKRGDEAGVLIDAFNRMLDKIQRHDELTAHEMERLHLTFEERSQDLRVAMAALDGAQKGPREPSDALGPDLSRARQVDTDTSDLAGRPPGPAASSIEARREVPLMDEEAVRAMAGDGARAGRDMVAKVWTLFLGKAPDAVFRLETLAAGGGPGALARQARVVRGLALSAGATRLAGLCETLESLADTADDAALGAALAEVRPALELTCAHMSAYLAARGASAA